MIDINDILSYMDRYGYLFLAGIVFLEYLNLPGLPAGIIMPAAGILIKSSGLNFQITLITSVIAALLGSWCLYAIGYYCGNPIIDRIENKFPKTKKPIDKTFKCIERYGDLGIFLSRLIPVARTLISIVIGTFKVNFFKFSLYSAIGITIWNFTFIYVGYAFSHLFF